MNPDTQPHPSLLKKASLSIALIVVSIGYAFSQRFSTQTQVAESPLSGDYQTARAALTQTLGNLIAASSSPDAPPANPSTTPAPVQTPTPTPQPKGQYRDGSYTGAPADAYYGTVQVQAIIKGGKIADVQFLQHPYTHQNSVVINADAMPLLTQEAISAQNAQVDGVSGATFTSQAFIESLSSALSQAKA